MAASSMQACIHRLIGNIAAAHAGAGMCTKA
jgi:hypothetical protein